MREAREQGIEFYSDEDEKAVLPAPADISDQVLVSIVKQQLPDDQVNALVWKYLGYKKSADGSWDNSAVFPKWRERFPLPPDLIGHDDKASYNQEDGSIKAAVQALQQSVPKEHKQRLKPTLTPLGWSGFVMEGLTPNMTRRAQCASWLLYYRTVLHGVSIDELIRRKKKRQAWEANLKDANQGSPASGTSQQAVFRRLGVQDADLLRLPPMARTLLHLRAAAALEAYLASGDDPEIREILAEARTQRTAGGPPGGAAAGRRRQADEVPPQRLVSDQPQQEQPGQRGCRARHRHTAQQPQPSAPQKLWTSAAGTSAPSAAAGRV